MNEHIRAGIAEDTGITFPGVSENVSRKISFQTATSLIDDEGFGENREGFREQSLSKSTTAATVHNVTVRDENANGTPSETIATPDRGSVPETGRGADTGCSGGGESCETATGVGVGCGVVEAEEKVLPSPLPEGWAEAVDDGSGHVYYFSDTR